MQHTSLRSLLLAGAVASTAGITGASAAEVTFERLPTPIRSRRTG